MPERNQHTRESDDAKATKPRTAELRDKVNHRISSICALAALVMCIIALASIVIGSENVQFTKLGIILSIILLAIAFLQEHESKR